MAALVQKAVAVARRSATARKTRRSLLSYRLARLRLRERVLFRPLAARDRLRLPLDLRRLGLDLLRLLLALLRLPPALRRRVEAALRADADRDDFDREADARPPFLPPFREELLLVFFPRPDPLFFPPPVSLFTVAHARRSASRRETPRLT